MGNSHSRGVAPGSRHLSATQLQEYVQWDIVSVIRSFVKAGLVAQGNPAAAHAHRSVSQVDVPGALRPLRESIRGHMHMPLTRMSFLSVFMDLSPVSRTTGSKGALEVDVSPPLLTLGLDHFRGYQKHVLHPEDMRQGVDSLQGGGSPNSGANSASRPNSGAGKTRLPSRYMTATAGWRARLIAASATAASSRSSLKQSESGSTIANGAGGDGSSGGGGGSGIVPTRPVAECVNGLEVVLVLAMLCEAALDDRLALLFDIFEASGKGALSHV
jgi:hypothetical protein